MNAITFIQGIRKSVIEENTGFYKELFQNTTQASDPYWKEALELFSSLSSEQKQTFFKNKNRSAYWMFQYLGNDDPCGKDCANRPG